MKKIFAGSLVDSRIVIKEDITQCLWIKLLYKVPAKQQTNEHEIIDRLIMYLNKFLNFYRRLTSQEMILETAKVSKNMLHIEIVF